MASGDLVAELKCPICLEIYTDPVNLSCGHSYCRDCICRTLDTQQAAAAYKCPECRKSFPSRPALQRNIALCNIVTIFSSGAPERSGSGVHCSYCIFFAVPAVRSCLHCEASLCSAHLRVHSKAAKHVLTDATLTPEKWKCPVHRELLRYRCCVDDTCICVTCLAREHGGHQVELLEEAAEKKKETFRTVLRGLFSERDVIEKKIRDLEESGSNDPGNEEATVLCPDVNGEEVLFAVSSLIHLFQIKKEKVSKIIRNLEELCNSSNPVSVLQEKGLDPQDLVEGQECGRISRSQELVLDISTAANNILVSEDLRTMYWSAVYQNRPETPQRFQYNQILGSQVFSSGRHLWEVETSETGDWRLGVAYGRTVRTGHQSYFGDNDKSWCLRRLYKNQYSVMHDNMVTTCPHTFSCNRFRIYLDYEVGLLSFYELSNPVRHLHTVTATFTEPLHAAFGIGYWLCGEHCCLKILHQDSLR